MGSLFFTPIGAFGTTPAFIEEMRKRRNKKLSIKHSAISLGELVLSGYL